MQKSDKKSLVKIERSDLTEERVKSYQENCREWTCIQNRNRTHMERNKRKEAITKRRKKIIPWSLGKREWYNKEWKMKERV